VQYFRIYDKIRPENRLRNRFSHLYNYNLPIKFCDVHWSLSNDVHLMSHLARRMKRVTIKDVALRSGVSKSTVSHVLNQTRFVEDQTKQKVLQAIRELNYRPSSIARSLVSQRTGTAGLLISDVGNPFYHDVILGVEEVALANGYSIFLCNTGYDLQRGMKYIRSLVDRLVDGIMFMSSNMNIDMIMEVHANSIQSVVLDWGGTNVSEMAATITIDFNIGICEAVRHLIEFGHKRIAFAGGPTNMWTAKIRKQAFLNAIEDCQPIVEGIVLTEGNLRIEGGYQIFEELSRLSPRPTAVIAANDLTALGIMWAARNAGYRLPEELSIVGLDNIDLASRVTPTLTTIALPRYEIGRLAMQNLLTLIHDPLQPKNNQLVDTHLIVRESTTVALEK
jgi:DNA-binding LacI/PurR family transcriptional regulator